MFRKINRIFDLHLPDLSHWPHKICGNCSRKVQQTSEFYELVENTQNEISQRFGSAEELEGEVIEESREEELFIDSSPDSPEPIIIDPIDDADDNSTPSKQKAIHMDSTIASFLPLTCHICQDLRFTSFLDLSAHCRSIHDTEGYVVCCEKRFVRRHKLYHHVLSHVNPRPHACDQCPKSFPTSYALGLHRELHLPAEEKLFQCPDCPRRYFREAKLKTHTARKHTPEHRRPFQCPACEKRFVNKSQRADHYKKIHENLRPFVCEFCAKSFKTKQILLDHLLRHTPQVRVKCEECGKFFQNEREMKRHQKRAHADQADNQVFQCTICGAQSKNSQALNSHINFNHKMDPQRYQCEVCPKGFKRRQTLVEHMAGHTGEKLYVCSFCDHKFNSSANRYKHQKNRHPEEYERMKGERDSKRFKAE